MPSIALPSKEPSRNGILVHGDNVQVLEAMSATLCGQVRCVYMDPPYRNGDSYSHYDDNQSHEQWISAIAGLLPRIWSVLSEDGSVWISIDDTEMAYLKVLCDVHFGRTSYVATIVWEHRTTRENRSAFSHNHEYVLVYAKNPSRFKQVRNKIEAPELLNRYKNPDNDSRGPWQSVTLTAQAGHAVASQFYAVVSPKTGKASYPPKGRAWVYSEQRMLREIADGNVWFGSDGNGVPRKKRFLRETMPAVVPSTLWSAKDAGTTMDAKKQLLKMFPQTGLDVFDTPKPEKLLSMVLGIATNPGDLVLDPYLGSGTTAAVAHKMGRRYIGIDKGAQSFDFARNRMRRVVEGDRSGVSRRFKWNGGGGFQSLECVDGRILRVSERGFV